jgi:hypothetical protein
MGALAEHSAVNRAQLEHVIRASAAISGDDEIVVIGSQSILGQFPAPPPELCASNEAEAQRARIEARIIADTTSHDRG